MHELLERAAASALDAAEVYELSAEHLSVEYENNRFKNLSERQSSGVALRVVKDGQVGGATSTQKGDLAVLDRAVAAAPHGRAYDFAFRAEPLSAAPPEPYDEALAGRPVEDFVAQGRTAIERLKAVGVDGALGAASATRQVGAVRVANSAGADHRYRQTQYAFFAALSLSDEGNFLNVYDYTVATHFVADHARLIDRVIENFRLAQDNAPFSAGRYPVLFHPRVLIDLLRPLLVGLNGQLLAKGISPLAGRQGEAVFDSRLSVLDDPTVPGGCASTPVDDEGEPTRPVTLLDQGRIGDFVHSLVSAATAGQTPNGHAQRTGLSVTPAPGYSQVIVAPGETPQAELLSQLKRGVWVENVMGTFTSNFMAGQVAGNISLGYWVEDGVRVGRVKDVAFSIDVYDALKHAILGLSREREWVATFHLPWMLLDNVSLAAKREEHEAESGYSF